MIIIIGTCTCLNTNCTSNYRIITPIENKNLLDGDYFTEPTILKVI